MLKVRACNLHHLRRQIYGRKDCTIYISYICNYEIKKEMSYSDYLNLIEELKVRNIKLEVEEE